MFALARGSMETARRYLPPFPRIATTPCGCPLLCAVQPGLTELLTSWHVVLHSPLGQVQSRETGGERGSLETLAPAVIKGVAARWEPGGCNLRSHGLSVGQP